MFAIISKLMCMALCIMDIIIFYEYSFELHYDCQSCIMHILRFMTEHENWTILMSHLIAKKNMQLNTNYSYITLHLK